MTTAELLTLINDMYAPAAAVTDALKVRYLNMGQARLTHFFGAIVTDESLVTVADQDEYALPTGIEDIAQIILCEIDTSAAPTTRYETQEYTLLPADDRPKSGRCIFQSYSSTGVKKLVIYPRPSLADCKIKIRYRKLLPDLSASDTSTSPAFDPRFHTLLATFACYQICANGPSPDGIQANRFAVEYEDAVAELRGIQNGQKVAAPSKRRENRMWTTRR